MNGDTPRLSDRLSELSHKYSMSQWGFAPLTMPKTIEHYRHWVEQGQHGEMSYLKTHLPLKEDAKKLWPLATSAIVFAKDYFPFPTSQQLGTAISANRIALYAQGSDYHLWFKTELQAIAAELTRQWPENHFLAMTDSSPVLERDLANKAGLGWFGKNTCLIHPKKGSLFFLGEIYTDLPAETENNFEPLPDFCGKCTKCIDVCPTGALKAPRQLDARKCISYLTIESKSLPSEALRPLIGDWLFGCDLCQTVCPWNQKVFKTALDPRPRRENFDREAVVQELRYLLTTSGKKLQKKFEGSALQRAGKFGLQRNAIIVAANLELRDLTPEIEALKDNERLRPLTDWALKILSSTSY